MKIYVYIFSLMLLTASCDSFLEYKDKDKIIPSELEQYAELIYGEILTKSVESLGLNVEMMTDDVGNEVPFPNTSTDDKRAPKYYNWYTWGKEPQIDPKGNEDIDKAWEYLYHMILMCNIIESDVSALNEDLDGVKFRLLGEVQCLRAMCYYYLAGMYAAPYRDSLTAKTAVGVPINKEIGIYDKLYTRSTLQEVYDLMETDLKMALINFGKGEVKNTIFRPNAEVAKLFLSRIYLTEKRYDEAISICNDALATTKATILPKLAVKAPLLNKNNPCFLFTWLSRWQFTSNHLASYSSRFLPSAELRMLFQKDDVRSIFFGYANLPEKDNYNTNTYKVCYRVEEFYFNKAEAQIEKGNFDLGLEEINKVRRERIDADDYKLKASDKAEAIRLFREEKRREFCFEDIRWYDMKRWGVEVTHVYNDFNDSEKFETFVLKADSPNYILPLPLDVQRRNDKIEKPERVDTKVMN